MSAHAQAHAVDDHGHHHKETFVTKYIFSTDHKMISKQYLITGLFMGIHWYRNVYFNENAACMARRAICSIRIATW